VKESNKPCPRWRHATPSYYRRADPQAQDLCLVIKNVPPPRSSSTSPEYAPSSVAAMANRVRASSLSGGARWPPCPPPLLPYHAITEPTQHVAAAHVVGVLDIDAPCNPLVGA
jgi:hypothetical protein